MQNESHGEHEEHGEEALSPRLVLCFGDLVLRSIPLGRAALAIGRRPYKDVALDDLTVSGEHAVILLLDGQRVLKDLNSRNGTLVNGETVHSHALRHGDVIEIGIYRLRYLTDRRESDHGGSEGPVEAVLEALTGEQPGDDLPIDRPIVSVNGGANQVAVVAHRKNGYFLTHLEGLSFPLVNGEPIGLNARQLHHGDLIELSGSMYRFRLTGAD